MLGIIILSQQVIMPGSLVITNNSDPISVANRTTFSMHLPILPILDTKKFKKFMDDIDHHVTKNPKNAIIDKNGNIIPEQLGYRLNRQVFTENIFSYYFNNGSSKLEVPLLAIYPRVDSELLGNIRGEKIGEYVTFFNFL
jgi:vancomycin resistance protein YoaR